MIAIPRYWACWVCRKRTSSPSSRISPVRLVCPGEDFHERGLASPVLPDYRVDLTGAALQVNPMKHLHPDEALLDAPHLEQRRLIGCSVLFPVWRLAHVHSR